MAAVWAVWANWVIPLVVTAGGTLAGHILSKTTEGVNWFGPADEPSETTKMTHTVRMWVGMQKERINETLDNDLELAGTTPWITLWGERGDLIAEKQSTEFVDQGESRDYIVGGKTNRKPGYDHWNAQCISAIQMTFAGGGSAVIFGDVAHYCGWPVYKSITEVTFKGDAVYQPWCMWLDWDDSRTHWPRPKIPFFFPEKPWLATDGHFPASVNFHIPDFMVDNVTMKAYQADKDLVCKAAPRLQAHPWMPETIAVYSPPLEYGRNVSIWDNITHFVSEPRNNHLPNTKDQPGVSWNQSEARKMPGKKVKRNPAFKKAPLDFSADIVTTGNRTNEISAQEMCDTKNAFGPSFVNLVEGKYCDMVNRIVLPICSEDVTHDCLQIENQGDSEERFTVIGSKPAVPEGADINFLALPKPVKKTYRSVTRMKSTVKQPLQEQRD